MSSPCCGQHFTVFAPQGRGPAYLEIPLDVLKQPLSSTQAPISALPLVGRPVPPTESIDAAVAAIEKAESVVIVAGGGAVGARSELVALAETLNAPVVLTVAGKAAFPMNHALCVGSVISRPAVQKRIESADVVIAIGTELSEPDTLLGEARLDLSGDLIRIDIDPGQLHNQYMPAVPVLGDAKATAALLVDASRGYPGKSESHVKDLMDVVMQDRKAASEASPKLSNFCKALEAAVPTNGIVVADSTAPAYFGNVWFNIPSEQSWLTCSRGFGTLGWALPAAIGAGISSPDRKVVCLVGDGGFMYTLEELSTARECELGLPVIIWRNSGYGAIRSAMGNAEMEPVATDFTIPNLQDLAKAFGVGYRRLDRATALKQTLADIWHGNTPCIVDVSEDEI